MSNKKNKKRFKPKHKIKKGDTVIVISGNDKGEQGRVLFVDAVKEKAIVEGVNMIFRHTKPNAQYTEGGIIKKEAGVPLSNLMFLDAKSGEPSRIGRKVIDGKIVRYAKKSGEVID